MDDTNFLGRAHANLLMETASPSRDGVSLLDRERPQVVRRRLPDPIYVRAARHAGTMAQEIMELLQRTRVALHAHLDRAGGAIADPTLQTQAAAGLVRGRAEAHPLDAPVHDGTVARHDRRR